MTYGMALVIEVDIAREMKPLVVGLLLTAVNLAIIVLLLYANAVRYVRDRRAKKQKKARQAQKIEFAVGFTEDKFATTLNQVQKDWLPTTHALAFWYSSLHEANTALCSGIPAISTVNGAVFTLHRPHELDELDIATFQKREAMLDREWCRLHTASSDELDELDIATFQKREAMLAVSVPWHLLRHHDPPRTVDQGGALSSTQALCVLPAQVLTALRGTNFGSLLEPEPWFQSGVLVPPHQIVRAFQLSEEEEEEEAKGGLQSNAPMAIDAAGRSLVRYEPFASGLGAREKIGQLSDRESNESISINSVKRFMARSLSKAHTHKSFLPPTLAIAQVGAVIPATCLQFTNDMSSLRKVCKDNGLQLVYHYTQTTLCSLILKMGFRMSTQGQGDGGVYFSTLGPATYGMGTDMYEDNIIVDCFGPERLEEYKGKGMLDLCLVYGADAEVLSQAPGPERLEEYKGKGMLDLCLVYGADAEVLSQAPGGRDNAMMVSKAMFQAFSLSDKDGNFFLRPDRILGAFLLPASRQPMGYAEAESSLAAEKTADMSTKKRLLERRSSMNACGDELRALHYKLHVKNADPQSDEQPTDDSDVVDVGDIELANFGGGTGSKEEICHVNKMSRESGSFPGDGCSNYNEKNEEEEEEEEEHESAAAAAGRDLRLSARLHTAQHFQGSQVLTARVRGDSTVKGIGLSPMYKPAQLERIEREVP
eukprot:CAMPEP_0171992938 /NCGR_PEP_ID=MMETSP0993-20121228/278194_1 /TAXON_ID=483369 /ORGANISM="non described non described, Strain CCMP2098" /LENGTH=708 /DNA_ID=CAMNT_0012645989 /DNA_START=729 /DNA_END=2856 /DNA_ORIENTATION=+